MLSVVNSRVLLEDMCCSGPECDRACAWSGVRMKRSGVLFSSVRPLIFNCKACSTLVWATAIYALKQILEQELLT